MTTIGYATLQIIPSLRGVSDAIDKEMRGKTAKVPVTADEQASRRSGQRAGKQFSDAAERETRGLGKKIGDAFDPSIQMPKVGRIAATALKGALLGGVAGVGAAIAGTVGTALFKGFERLKSIDDAKFKLQALGNSAADVQRIMDSALASVKGTAFGLGDAATVAANAVAAGVKPGQDLTKYLKMTADAAAIAGSGLGDMGQIINQVRTGQKAYTDDLNQLADRGIPIYQWLSDQLHISAADVKSFAADGKISSADFEAAIQQHIGGAALTMGQSFSGSVQNAEAALGRLGAAFLQPVFGNFAGGIGSVTTGLDSLTAWVDAHQTDIITFFETIGSVAITAAENVARGAGGMLQAIGDLVGGIGNVKGVLDNTMAFFADLRGDDAGAAAFRKSAQEAFGWGEQIRALGDKLVNANFDAARQKVNAWGDAARQAATDALNAHGEVAGLGQALGALPFRKVVGVEVDVAQAKANWETFRSFITNQAPVKYPVSAVPAPPGGDALAPSFFTPPTAPPRGGGRAGGGMIPGFSTTDDRLGILPGRGLIGLAGGEGIVKATATRKLGGKPFIDFLNGFADGGVVPPDVAAAQALTGTEYSKGARTDCSGMVARVIARTLGMPESGLMSTKTASEWLAERGFVPGTGGPGQISVGWYDHGPNPNDGHMAMTLSDGSNAEAGGSVGVFTVGGSAAGANSPQFDQHMFLPTVYGEGPAGSGSASPFAGGSAAAAVTGGAAAPTSSSGGGGGTSSSGGGGGSGFSLPSSISDLAKFGLGDLGKGVGTTGSGSDLSLFGEAAGAAVSGQVDSALGVLGVNGSPGWLKGISTLISGISIGGGGGSAAPLSATSTGMGTPPPDDAGNMHGSRAGQQPGPVYNITARDTEDAFIKAQRLEREKSAAKLSRF